MNKKLGIALGSGSARGWAHIGVLNALEESGIKVDYISGTSIGSVVGAVYSIGDIKEFEKFARSIDWKSIVSFIDVTFPGSGLIPGKKVFKMLSEYYKDILIEDLPVPYCTVAADVLTG
ncbi:MAG: patatin-like phospholipase family protein, partial [Candidatus Aminicenantes bacterium]|nr:patatin-like phospholipase family protein [Candidatus Aminicenantes bacterium]